MNPVFEFLTTYPSIFLIFVFLMSLVIGSFLNVVIYRIPIMLKQSWRAQCLEFLELPEEKTSTSTSINLSLPGSHCPKCQHRLRWYENIPLISFIFLGGKCSQCKTPISWRYPLVELLTAILSILIAHQWGLSFQTLSGLIFTWFMIPMVFIDIDHHLLPDQMTLSFLWIGLLISLKSIFVGPQDAIIGACVGYLSLWLVAWLFRKIRGIEGMGYGDFKLFAGIGAWLGWQVLPLTILIASLFGAIFGIIYLLTKKLHRQTPIPFGPYLAFGGWVALFYGPNLMNLYFNLLHF